VIGAKLHLRGYGDFLMTVPDREMLYGALDFAKVCPVCLDIWATFATNRCEVHRIVPSVCELCLPPLHEWGLVDYHLDPVPGSLISRPDRPGVPIDWHLFEALPDSLVHRECKLTLAAVRCPKMSEVVNG
jgi:hypothetical protein